MIQLFISLIISVILLISSLHDIKTYKVPHYLTYIIILISLIYAILSNNTKILLIAGLLGLILGWSLAEFDIWGGADSKLLIAMALFLGFSWYFVILIYVAIIYSISFLILSKIKKEEVKIAFVPVFFISYMLFLILC